ncbi:hypothetical protein C3L33_22969, partial [Rhododendron williamsianum]
MSFDKLTLSRAHAILKGLISYPFSEISWFKVHYEIDPLHLDALRRLAKLNTSPPNCGFRLLFTSLLIHRCMDSNPLITTYLDIGATAFGKKRKNHCFNWFLKLEGDNLLSPNFALKLGNLALNGRHSFVIVAGVMIFPSTWLSDLGILLYISFGGVISSIIIVVAVFFVGTTKEVGFHGKGILVSFKGLPTALSLYAFCYGVYAMFPTIYNSMRKKSQFPKIFRIYRHFGYELAGISGLILLAISAGAVGTYSAIAHTIKEA